MLVESNIMLDILIVTKCGHDCISKTRILFVLSIDIFNLNWSSCIKLLKFMAIEHLSHTLTFISKSNNGGPKSLNGSKEVVLSALTQPNYRPILFFNMLPSFWIKINIKCINSWHSCKLFKVMTKNNRVHLFLNIMVMEYYYIKVIFVSVLEIFKLI